MDGTLAKESTAEGSGRRAAWMRRALRRLGWTLAAAAVLATLGAAAWAVALDAREAELIPPGVSVEGADIGGLTVAQAEARIEAIAAGEGAGAGGDAADGAGGSLRAVAGTMTFELDPGDYVEVRADTLARDAQRLRARTDIVRRTRWRIETMAAGAGVGRGASTGAGADAGIGSGIGMGVDLPLRTDLDQTALDAWLEEVAERVELEAVDATRSVGDDGGYVTTPDREGRVLDRTRSLQALRDAVLEGEGEVELAVRTIEPRVTAEDFGRAIVVDLSERRLYLYDGLELEKEYGVAIGTWAHPTPRGEWEVTLKRYMPTWSNPGSAWAASMPAYIGPGPSNPLGTRAINLDASGIRIHGTTQDWSIGRAASHGCMRMHRWDVEDLYERVEVGMPVTVTS